MFLHMSLPRVPSVDYIKNISERLPTHTLVLRRQGWLSTFCRLLGKDAVYLSGSLGETVQGLRYEGMKVTLIYGEICRGLDKLCIFYGLICRDVWVIEVIGPCAYAMAPWLVISSYSTRISWIFWEHFRDPHKCKPSFPKASHTPMPVLVLEEVYEKNNAVWARNLRLVFFLNFP